MPATIHEHPEEWLATALADGLTPEERRALDEHLAGCECCRQLQMEFAALDEALLRDVPLAIEPERGFETRMVAGFRQRTARPDRLEKLRALLAWLVRQRGVQFAGVAAALSALVGIGSMLTQQQPMQFAVTNSIQKKENDHSVASRQMSFVLAADDRLSDKDEKQRAAGSTSDITVNNRLVTEPRVYRNNVPIGDIDTGRDVTAGLTDAQIPGSPRLDGKLASNSARNGFDLESPERLKLLDGRRSTAPAKSDVQDQRYSAVVGLNGPVAAKTSQFDGFINYGSPIQTAPAPQSSTAPATKPKSEPADHVVIVGSNIPTSEEVGVTPVADAPAPADTRKLIRNAHAQLEVTSFDATVDAITAAATRDGGFLDTRNSARGANGKVSGTLVVKVLPQNLDRFLTGLRTLGEVKDQTIQTEDVTKDYFDTDARLRNAKRMEDRLLKMLDEVKGKMSEVLQVEKELARVRAEIQTMQGQLKLYDSQVRFATVTLAVNEKNLDQPAAFLLRETATLALLADDAEKTAAETRRIADDAHAQTVRSEITRDPSGKSRATLRLLIAPEAADGVIAKIKALGRVANFHLQDERIAQNGGGTDATPSDTAKVERAPVALDLTISHDEQISRQESFTVITPEVEAAFEKARSSATTAGAEITNANVTHPSAGHANATLEVRVPVARESDLVAAFKALGRPGNVESHRIGNSADSATGPVFIQLSLADAEPAVQRTTMRVLTGEVERSAGTIKREAAGIHATIEESTFASESDGQQRATLRIRLSMSACPAFVDRLRTLGTVKDLSVQRQDRPDSEATAPAVIDLTLYSEGRVVAESSGLGATIRQTFGQGAGAVMWSVRMIGVALAFLAPWTVLATLVWLVLKRRSNVDKKSTNATAAPASVDRA